MSGNSKGFTVVEALLAVALLGIVLTGVLPGFLTFLDSNTFSESASDAVAAGQVMLERLRLQDPSALPTSGKTSPEVVLVGNREYEVTNTYCLVSSYCGTDSRHVRVEVNYGGDTLFVVESVFTRLQ